MSRSWSIARKLALTFALGPIAMAIVGAITFESISKQSQIRGLTLRSYNVRVAIQETNAALLSSETSARNYVLTGDRTYLAGYRSNLQVLNQDLDTLQNLTASDAPQQARLASLRPLIAHKIAVLDSAIQRRGQNGLSAGLAVLQQGRNASMQQIGAIMKQTDDAETRTQTDLNAALEERARMTLDAIVYGTILTVIALAIIGTLVIRNVSKPVQDAVVALTSATSEILAGTAQQASGVQEQAAAVAETVSTVEEIAQTAEQSNSRARAVADSARRAAEDSTSGNVAVERSIQAMEVVKTRTGSIADSILSLADQAQAIGEINALVNDLAEQTNLLALNASIEASRAGEHGKGFSVVAGEIKSLAEQSKKATVQVRQILTEIQKATSAAVMATEEGTKSVEEATRTVTMAGDSIRSLAETIAEAARAATQISASTEQQSVGMSQIQQAMRNINQATNQNLASTQQAGQAARDLDAVGLRLRMLLRGAAG